MKPFLLLLFCENWACKKCGVLLNLYDLGSVWIEGEGGRAKGNRGKLTENKLIFSQIYSILLYSTLLSLPSP